MKVSFGDDHVDSTKVDECRAPLQKNGHNCGLFVSRFAEALSNNDCIKISDKGTSFDTNALSEYFEGSNFGDGEITSNLCSQMLELV